jgi:aminoglycoside phosphotransferase (APT) family kinase protein
VAFGDREFVLRRPPFGPVAPTAHDMPREYRLLTLINPLFPLAPRPYLLCEDESIIGAPFYIMERRRGLVIRHQIPPQIGEGLRRRVSQSVIDTLAQLHSIDIYSTGLEQIGKPIGFVARQVKGWTDRWHRAKTTELPQIEEVVRWLNQRLPPEPDRASLVHNDFKLDNLMLDVADPTRVIAVLDWEMCTVGDPLVDLGIFLCYWVQRDDPEDRREAISPVTAEPGWMTRQEILQRYAEKTGRNLSNIDFYEIFALFKLAVVLQQIYFRYVRGQTRDERFKDFDRRVLGLARIAHQMVQQSKLPAN